MIMRRYKCIASLIIFLVAVCFGVKAQEQPNSYVTSVNWSEQATSMVEKGTSLEQVLSLVESKYNVNFLYDSRLLVDKNLSGQRVLNFEKGHLAL